MAAYNAMWAELVTIGKTSDWNNPKIGEYLSGQPLSNWTSSFASDKHKGYITLGQPTLNPRVVSVTPTDSPTRVEIADCFDNSGWIQYLASSGAPVDNKRSGGRIRTEAALTFDPVWQRWMVTQQIFGKVGSC